ncbi:hypothetical protein L1787_10105 [Acuticoccus sp. M5D2P5]|uniref:hypothetical protein n=1 Tax=Acuticoccus kalidii TaxID=2910977 RepID=UPI001F1ED0F1|nr:hypothetical protein [Acuticoccus kalidii]MCF3933766.1 hypothetical protein [Acuticoccus kalidii]
MFALAWLFALAVLAIGTFGLFGEPRDPLAAVYLVPLGLPWNRMLDRLDDPVRVIATALAPGVNLAIIRLICRTARMSGPGR